jgi:cytochrome c-type biogenesis protein
VSGVALLSSVASSGEVVRDGSLLVAVPIAMAAGLVSFLSPCVLPLVPGYLSYVTGTSGQDVAESSPDASPGDGDGVATAAHPARRIALGALGFVLGISVVFVSFGAVFGGLGRAMRDNEELLTRIFGVLTILLGLLFAGVFSRVGLLNREVRFHRVPRAGWLGAPLLGITFALGWTPCIGPTLGVVLGLAASSDQASAVRGAVLSFAYCLGLGVPFLVTGLAFSHAMAAFAVVKRHYRAVVTAGGAMLVVIGVLQVTGVWTQLMNDVQTRFGTTELPL